MKNFPQLALVVLILMATLYACQTDDFPEVEDENPVIVDEIPTIVESNLIGVVLDEENQPIVDAEILVSGEMTTTDENGVFRFIDFDLSSDGSLIKITKDGYFDGFQFVHGEAGKFSQIKATLLRREDQIFQNSTGGTIEANGGSSIIFEENSIAYPNGDPYQGAVTVSAHWYDPSTDDLIYTMPGDLRGIDENSETVQLRTYGMMVVELLSATGEELQVAFDRTATMMFPIPNGSDARDYDAIPTWHLDETTGIWMEEGEAKVEGNFLVAEVSHFSFWNCDIPFPYVHIKGTLVSENGEPLPFHTVTIKDNNNNISRTGITNESGVFSGKVPAGVDLSLFHIVCEENNPILGIGVLMENTELGEVSIPMQSNTSITANFVGCDAEPTENTYVIIITPSGTEIVSTGITGEFDYTLFHCNETNMTLQAYDLNSNFTSEPITINTDQLEMNLGTVTICEDIIGENIIYFINDETHDVPLNNISALFVDNRMLNIYAISTSAPNGSRPNLFIKYDMIDNIGQYAVSGTKNNGDYLATNGDDLEIEVSDFDQVGDLITVTFDNGEFRGELTVELDKIVESGEVRGTVWLDDNQDGIKDPGELPLAGKRFSIFYVFDPAAEPLFGPRYYPFPHNSSYSVESDSDGNFTFTGVLVEERLHLSYHINSGIEEVSPVDVGNNDWIDSDFYIRFTGTGQYDTNDFILENGGEKVDFGLGIIQ